MFLGLAAAGVALGVINVFANYGLLPGSPHVPKIVGRDWGWLAAGSVACWPGRNVRDAMLRGVVLFTSAVVTYELLDRVVAVRTNPGLRVDAGGVPVNILFWTIAGIVASAGLALVVRGARRRDALGLACAMALPLFIAWTIYDVHSMLNPRPGPRP